MRTALVLVGLLASSAGSAEELAQAEPPAYGSASSTMAVRAHPMIGFSFEGAAPFGDFGRGSNFGFQVVGRGGVELVIGPGIYVAPDGEINFVRFGASNDAQALGISSGIGVGFM